MRPRDRHEHLDLAIDAFHVEPTDPETTPHFALGTLEIEKVPDDDVVELVHDFKNPLTTIALEMMLLQDKLAYAATPDVRAAFARINRNIAFLDRLVQDMLDSSSLDAGSFALQQTPTELCALLHQVIERTVPSRDRARIYIEAPGRVVLSIDALRIERVIANLLGNALKYAPGGSTIVVRLEREATCVRVSVIDSGPGIDDEQAERIFERHQRTSDASAHVSGSGLGLYVSKRIVEAHGGRIGVASVRAIGSRFFFELPV